MNVWTFFKTLNANNNQLSFHLLVCWAVSVSSAHHLPLLSIHIHLEHPHTPIGRLCSSLSPPLPTSRYLFIPPSPRPSVCLVYLRRRIVLLSSSLNKTRLRSPWGGDRLVWPADLQPRPLSSSSSRASSQSPPGVNPYPPHFSPCPATQNASINLLPPCHLPDHALHLYSPLQSFTDNSPPTHTHTPRPSCLVL